MLRSVFVAAAAAVLLAVGALSAMAGNSHAKPAGTLATNTTFKGEATSELKAQAVQPNADTAQGSTQTQGQPAQAETDEAADDATDEDTDDATEAGDEAAPGAPAAAAPATKSEQEGAGQDD